MAYEMGKQVNFRRCFPSVLRSPSRLTIPAPRIVRVGGAVLPISHRLDQELDPGVLGDGVCQVLAVSLVLIIAIQLLPPDGLPEHHVGLLQDRGHDVLLGPVNDT